jgi:hypothetical protein
LSLKEQLACLEGMRRFISSSEEPPIAEIMSTNVLPVLAQVLAQPDQFEEIRRMKVLSSPQIC